MLSLLLFRIDEIALRLSGRFFMPSLHKLCFCHTKDILFPLFL